MFIKKKIKSKTPMDYALRVLAKKDYFENELLEKISEHFGKEAAQETLEKLKGYGYVNDEKCREMLVAARLRSGYGVFRISQELKEKGVEDNLSDIEKIAGDHRIDRQAVLEEQIKKFLENKKAENNYELKQKCIAHFYRKGHPFSDVEKIINRELEL